MEYIEEPPKKQSKKDEKQQRKQEENEETNKQKQSQKHNIRITRILKYIQNNHQLTERNCPKVRMWIFTVKGWLNTENRNEPIY